MEMEDHHQDHRYATITDLRQLITSAANRPPTFPAAHDLFTTNQLTLTAAPPPPHQFNTMLLGRQLQPTDLMLTANFMEAALTDRAIVNTNANTPLITSAPATSFRGDKLECEVSGGDAGTGRWPRQETLTLLEIRSRLDLKFKEANQKGPLWDEIARIMFEEHGYQRSGKKCREKFENLYKYYKKTKEGKAGRQDGKHYRFFRQLEALYGESSTNSTNLVSETHLAFQNTQNGQDQHYALQVSSQNKFCDSLSLSNSLEFDTSSSEDNEASEGSLAEKRKKRRGGRRWKAKIKDFIDSQMRKLMEKQEAWLEKMMRTLEQKEEERVTREEEWRRQEAARMDREHKFWVKERAWIETRDAALMEIMEKIRGRDVDDRLKGTSSPPEEFHNQSENGNEILNSNAKSYEDHHIWTEPEITRLIQLRTSLESRLHSNNSGTNEELFWGEIAAKMCCYGYERSASMCKEKWDAINYFLIKRTKEEHNKKLKEDNSSTPSSTYFRKNDFNSLYNNNHGQGGSYCEIIKEQGPEMGRLQPNDGSSPSSSNAGNVAQDSCFRFLIGDCDQQPSFWENYGSKLKREN